MRMPRKARAAMNRAGLQDPEELKRRRKRFRELARAYKAEETLKNVKRTAKDVGKELAVEAATAAAGGLAGKALVTGYRAYKAAKGAKKVAKGAQKMLKAGPERKLLMAPRAKAAEKIQRSGPPKFKKKIKRSGPPEFERSRKMTTKKAYDTLHADKTTPREALEANRFLAKQSKSAKAPKRVAKSKKAEAKPVMASVMREAKAMKQNQINALFSRIGPRTFEYGGKRNQALRDALAKLGRAPKNYKLNKSGMPPAPKPKAKRKKPAKRKAGAPVKQTPSKPVKFDKKRRSRSEIRKNRAVQNNPRRIVRKLESRLETRKGIRRGYQQDYNEMQRKGTTEFMRRHPDFVKGMGKDFYRPDKFLARKKRGMETYKRKIYETQMDLEKARRRAKRSQIKPRRRN